MVDRADGKHLVFLGCKGYGVEGYRVHNKRTKSGFTGLSRTSSLSGAYRVWKVWRRLLLLLLLPTLLPLMLLRCLGQLMPLAAARNKDAVDHGLVHLHATSGKGCMPKIDRHEKQSQTDKNGKDN